MDASSIGRSGQTSRLHHDEVENVAAVARHQSSRWMRYRTTPASLDIGNVRKTDVEAADRSFSACSHAFASVCRLHARQSMMKLQGTMFHRISIVRSAIHFIRSEEQTRDWLNALSKVTDRNCPDWWQDVPARLAFEQRTIDIIEAARRVGVGSFQSKQRFVRQQIGRKSFLKGEMDFYSFTIALVRS